MRSIVNGVPEYSGQNLDYIGFPLGGLGAGNICIQGTGALSGFSIRNQPDYYFEPNVLSAICVKEPGGNIARVLEGPVPKPKIFGGALQSPAAQGKGGGAGENLYGLPRCQKAVFRSRFPFAEVELEDPVLPVTVSVTAWSPFIPGNEDDSSLPAGFLTFCFYNVSNHPVDAVYYFCSENMMRKNKEHSAYPIPDGFVLHQEGSESEPWLEGSFCAQLHESCNVDTAWFRGGWFDAYTMLWNGIQRGESRTKCRPAGQDPGQGAMLSLPFYLGPGEEKKITLQLCWYVPHTNLRCYEEDPDVIPSHRLQTYSPWYSGRFACVEEVAGYLYGEYSRLYGETHRFTECFYDTNLPSEALEAAAANLSILKSPTILRQTDGRLWCWEGCMDRWGSCMGSCTHVWNYAQAICNLFPSLERTLRETEFLVSQDEHGHQNFRSSLPIRPCRHDFYAASDGQLGGLIKLYRDYTICGDLEWLTKLWPAAKQSMEYCIATWDPDEEGLLREPHHNTYDIEFWGQDGMCSSFYLGALAAMEAMAAALGESGERYTALREKGRAKMQQELFNGRYFEQKVRWKDLNAQISCEGLPEEERERLEEEGPKYQYGEGCLSDGVLGAWLAELAGLPEIIDRNMIESHLLSVFRYNFKDDLSGHANPQRPGYALGKEGGLLLCTWPKGGKPSLPFVYSDEVWTGIEYQVATHLMMHGYLDQAVQIIRTTRSRYDGTVRNPYDEYECGHWYARALASYACIQAFSGARYDAASKTLYLHAERPKMTRTFLATSTGYGTLVVNGDQVDLQEVSGKIEVHKIVRKG